MTKGYPPPAVLQSTPRGTRTPRSRTTALNPHFCTQMLPVTTLYTPAVQNARTHTHVTNIGSSVTTNRGEGHGTAPRPPGPPPRGSGPEQGSALYPYLVSPAPPTTNKTKASLSASARRFPAVPKCPPNCLQLPGGTALGERHLCTSYLFARVEPRERSDFSPCEPTEKRRAPGARRCRGD